ncbi:MAG: hypothetical protein ABII68_10005 [Pseudomonadota bacterium]
MKTGETGERLANMIKKAISDCEVTVTEFNQILAIAEEDGIIDAQEQNLLTQLQHLIANGTIKRVPG